MKRTKVVQFIHGFTTGGAENIVKQYSLLFNKEKIDLLVVALHNHNSFFDSELKENRIRVVYIDDLIDLKFKQFPETVKKVMHRLLRKIYVRKVIRCFNPEVIHYHLLLSDYVRYTNPKIDTKIFLTVHSDPKQLWNKRRARQKDKKNTEWLVRHCCFRFIALHEEMRKDINEMFDVTDTIIVNNGVMFDRFEGTNSKTQIRANLGIPGETTVIGHIGRFTEAKNHMFLVEIFERYLEINADSVLILIGVGNLQDKIREYVKKKQIEQKVYFLGARNDIPEMLHAMDIMVFPSLYEGLPVTLVEAQAAGVRCLVSDRVTRNVKISNFIFFESLEETSGSWAATLERIISTAVSPLVNAEGWDMKSIVGELEKMYEN